MFGSTVVTAGSARSHLIAACPSVRPLGEEPELVDLPQPLLQPLLGAVAAVVVLGEHGVLRVLALEHARGVGDAHHEADAVPAGDLDQVAAGVLLEQVVDDLQRRRTPGW